MDVAMQAACHDEPDGKLNTPCFGWETPTLSCSTHDPHKLMSRNSPLCGARPPDQLTENIPDHQNLTTPHAWASRLRSS